MTVFIAHAPADREAAEALEKFIERRGQFAELDDGQTAMRPVQPNDVVVLLISQQLIFAPTRLRLEQRSLDAWAEGRLVAVKLDTSIAPVGLRDLPAIDASFEAQREFKWQEVANAIREHLRAPQAGTDQASAAPRKRRGVGGGLAVGATGLAIVVAVGLALQRALFIEMYTTTVAGGQEPNALHRFVTRAADTLRVAEEDVLLLMGGAVGLIAAIVAIAIGWTVIAVVRRLTRAQRRTPAGTSGVQLEPAPTDAVFVSYARANAPSVLPVIEAAKQEGKIFWLDQQGIGAGEGWAGEIVRAIRAAPRVLVMCSKAAFESDHVKREIYLADRYQKRLVPVFIEQADPPEDFEYFFAGVQMLNLFETPEAERPQALMRALGAT